MGNREVGAAAVGSMCLGMVQTNCYFVFKEDGKNHKVNEATTNEDEFTEVIFFDHADRGELIYDELHKRGFKVAAIYLTHAHFDHIAGADKLKELSGAKIYAYEKERRVCEDPIYNLSNDFTGRSLTIKPDEYLHDGDMCEAAGLKFKLIATPGHTEGSCCYYLEDEKILISGDTLFAGSVGRTDLPTGSMKQLLSSIETKLMSLPDDVDVYPGHGEPTTIGYERKWNPFFEC